MKRLSSILALLLVGNMAFAKRVIFNVDIFYFKGTGEVRTEKPTSQIGHEFCRSRGFYGSNMVFVRATTGPKGDQELSINRIECGEFPEDLSEDAKASLMRIENLKDPLLGPYDPQQERQLNDDAQ